MAGHGPADKALVRRSTRGARDGLGAAELRAADARLGRVLAAALPELLRYLPPRRGGDAARAPSPGAGSPAPVLGAYVSLPGEPPTGSIRRVAGELGCEVLLPWLRSDLDLDWVRDDGAALTGREAALRPPGARLGREAVLRCGLLLVPALAVDTRGRRLGQGGGSYDRVLARVRSAGPAAPLVLAVLHAGELRDAATAPLPQERHDVAVDGVLVPDGLVLLRAGPAE